MKGYLKRLNEITIDGFVYGFTAVKNQKGQSMVEYGLLLALIAVAVIATLRSLGVNINSMFNKAASGLQ